MDIRRFSLKFKRIVRAEAGDNFITKLHRGNLVIMPWPFVQSARFYRMFGSLKASFEEQPITYTSAIDFLRVLKMLMAKLKVSRVQLFLLMCWLTLCFRFVIGVP